jgi:hypothetical protein
VPVESRNVSLLQDRELGVLGVTGSSINFRQTPH